MASLLALVAIMAGRAIYNSRHFRIKRVERLPRHKVAFLAQASFKNATSRIIVLDISSGGAKIECDHPPRERENITLHLVCGSIQATIVWATSFYAGVMFENALSREALTAVLEDRGVTTRSRLDTLF